MPKGRKRVECPFCGESRIVPSSKKFVACDCGRAFNSRAVANKDVDI